MPWYTPTLKQTRELVRDDVTSALSGAVLIGNNVLRVMSDTMAGLCHLTLRYIDWLSLQFLPDTAETEWLDRHGDIWLVNSDGTTGRKMATLSVGSAYFTGVAGAVVPANTQLLGPDNNIGFETTQQITILADALTPAPIRALDPGAAGNLPDGTPLSLVVAPINIDDQATVIHLTGGTDDEIDSDLRVRVLERIRQPPMGGSQADYVAWAKAVPGVTRAWCAPLEMGMGTVTVRIMMDDLRASNNGFPYQEDLDAVAAYIDTVRPVAVKDFWVVSPIPQRVDVHIANLNPDNEAVRGAIESVLNDMMRQYAAPGQTIFAAWKYYAVMSAPGVISFDITDNSDDIMLTPGNMGVLGDIYYDETPVPVASPVRRQVG